MYAPAGRDLLCLEQGAHTVSTMGSIQSGWYEMSQVGVHSGPPGGSEGEEARGRSTAEAEAVWLEGTLADREDCHCRAQRSCCRLVD